MSTLTPHSAGLQTKALPMPHSSSRNGHLISVQTGRTVLGLAGARTPNAAMNPTKEAIPARASVRMKVFLIHGLRRGKGESCTTGPQADTIPPRLSYCASGASRSIACRCAFGRAVAGHQKRHGIVSTLRPRKTLRLTIPPGYLDRLNNWLSGSRAKEPSRAQALLMQEYDGSKRLTPAA